MSHELIAKRYERDPDGTLIIDIAIDSVNDLYNEFDKKAVFRKRELDQDFVDYLIECVTEIKEHNYFIKISLPAPLEDECKGRIKTSICNYFVYLKEVEVLAFKKEVRKTLLLFLFGICLITLSIFGPLERLAEQAVWLKVLQEGIVIAAWVTLWQVFAALIFEWQPLWQQINLYRRISSSHVEVVTR
ncbi:MAG: hypothetical protein OEY01_08215 [Desulfobulbaceae bacterium]|nr:hypothetical protein [Desulfobulbaceae bacterium]